MKATPQRTQLFYPALVLLGLCELGVAAPEGWREVRSAAVRAMRSDSASERESAFVPLGKHDHEDGAEFLVKAAGSPTAQVPVREHARDVLSTFHTKESRDFLYGVLRSRPDKNHLLLEAFAAMEDERAPAIGTLAMRGVARAKNAAPVRAAAIRCLVASGEPSEEVAKLIIGYAGDDHPLCVRFAATDSLLAIRSPDAIAKLVSLLDDPALKTQARLLMVRIAGADAGLENRSWEEWWKKQGESPPAAQPLDEPEARELIAAAKTGEGADAGGASVSFYGIPIEGKKVLFVLDSSGSMEGDPMVRLKSECRKMVVDLPEAHQFALVFFPGNDCYPRHLEPASEKLKKRAYTFIEKRHVNGSTPIGKAMTFAYRQYVEGGGEVDAIYLLSDGAPTRSIPDVLRMIGDLNLGLYIPIHTIFIGEKPDPVPGVPAIDFDGPPEAPIKTGPGFLKEVARRHNGTFTIVAP